MVPDVETRIVETEHETARGALGDAHREHARKPPPDGEVLIRIEQRIDELADTFLRDFPERKHRVIGHLIPRQQRDRVRDEARGQAVFSRQHLHDAEATARPQAEDVAHFGVERRRIDCGARDRAIHLPPE